MKKYTEHISAVIVLAVIISVCAIGLSSCMDFNSYVRNTYEINDGFSDISITTVVADIRLLPSSDGQCRVETFLHEKVKYEAAVSGDCLSIETVDTRRWYDKMFSNGFEITLYLPEEIYRSLTIDATTSNITLNDRLSFEELRIDGTTGDVLCHASVSGDIDIELTTGDVELLDVDCKSVEIKLTTGDVELEMVNCADLTLELTTGEVDLDNVIASGIMDITLTTGGVDLEACDAAEIYIETTTGSVEGSLLTDKIIHAKATTGKVDVPSLYEGGICEITTVTGDIEIRIKGR